MGQMLCVVTDVVHSTVDRRAHDRGEHEVEAMEKADEAQRKMSSRKSSLSHTSSCNDLMRAEPPPTTVLATSAGPKSRLDERLKVLAQYVKNMSKNVGQKQREIKARRKGSHVLMMRNSQVGLSQYLPHAQSAPDVLVGHMNRNNSVTRGLSVTRNSSPMTHPAPLSWDEICAGAILIEENEVFPASPPSRKRSRPRDLLEDSEIRRLCLEMEVPNENVTRVVNMVSRQFGTSELDLIVLHELVGGNSIVFVGMLVFECIDSGEEYLDLQHLPELLQHIQTRYQSNNPFHNACHAADVLHSLFVLLWTTELGRRIAVHNQIGVLLAAIMHDVEHIGLTNDFLLRTNHEIAVKFGTPAPMEEMHIAVAVDMIKAPLFQAMSKLSSEQQEEVLAITRETIRSTALCHQKEMLRDIAGVPSDVWQHEESMILPINLQTLVLRCAMHVSDISQTMKPFSIHEKWVGLLNEEHFRQGDVDRLMQLAVCPPLCFRDQWTRDAFIQSQVGFLEFLVAPAARALNSIPWMDVEPMVDQLQQNINKWRSQQSSAVA
ncbi:hypothetical protein Poli38472_006713 [Pythium oligandrum]|uniref:Phosphodiesterase n=1 Tax=Pythium oligandrum TaxID=41045 RepID=A0A8K1C5C0_PYTOL|nr:hypothetical protein Poli38472_006713 [Pythium oligandrum]|eukprot:TMW56703.1 hypothetical protein Poli38472_006713 [Pythium oligandrum]